MRSTIIFVYQKKTNCQNEKTSTPQSSHSINQNLNFRLKAFKLSFIGKVILLHFGDSCFTKIGSFC